MPPCRLISFVAVLFRGLGHTPYSGELVCSYSELLMKLVGFQQVQTSRMLQHTRRYSIRKLSGSSGPEHKSGRMSINFPEQRLRAGSTQENRYLITAFLGSVATQPWMRLDNKRIPVRAQGEIQRFSGSSGVGFRSRLCSSF